MSYNDYLKVNGTDPYSQKGFTKSPSKFAQGNLGKEEELEMIKEKYGIGKGQKNTDNVHYQNLKKVPEQVYNLRGTVNPSTYATKFSKSTVQDNSPKQQYSKSPFGKPEFNLRHTVYEKKVEESGVGSYMPSTKSKYESHQNQNYYQEPTISYNYAQHEAASKGNQGDKTKIDFDKITEKLKNNAMMIEELRKLKEQKKNRKEKSSQLNLDEYESKLAPSKSTDVFAKSPKVSKENPEGKKKNSNEYNYKVQEQPKLQSPVYSKKESQEPLGSPNKLPNNLKPKSSTESTSTKANIIGEINDFILVKNLGEGKFGTVFLSFHKPTGGVFALKKVPKEMIKQHFLVDQFILELKLQSYFRHPNILEIFGFFEDKDSFYLILEYMEEGTLFSYLKKSKVLKEVDAAKKIKDVADAVNAIHQQLVAHRDIKPQNIVMSHGVCKLCDFGWATICNDRRKTYCGTFDYAAPQILEGTEYDMSVDTWCLGILAYELLVGKAPFYHISRKQTMKKIMNVDQSSVTYPESMSKVAISFIQHLIVKNPQQRMKSDQIVKHKFLKIEDSNLS